jgi:acetyl-CoA acetyltransferase
MGHPLGATRAIRLVAVMRDPRRNELKYGMATLDSGMGAAGIFERV